MKENEKHFEERQYVLDFSAVKRKKKLSGIMNSFSDFQINRDKLPWIKMRMLLSME